MRELIFDNKKLYGEIELIEFFNFFGKVIIDK